MSESLEVAPDEIARAPSVADQSEPLADARNAVDALARAHDARGALVRASHAPATQAKYAADWAAFVSWCRAHEREAPELVPLPASDATLSLWVGAHRHLAPSTLARKLAAVRLAHERAGHALPRSTLPATRAALAGHARLRAREGDAAPHRATAATAERLIRMVDALGTLPESGPFDEKARRLLRNRALLLIGFDAAFRRSELVGIDVEHLEWTASGLSVRVPRSKSDQAGVGAWVPILRRPSSSHCPVAALERWCEAGERHAGPLFVSLHRARHTGPSGSRRLSGAAVARIVKGAARDAGLDGAFSGHSLRRGLITSAIEADVPMHRVQQHARHARIDTTLAYVEHREPSEGHPGAALLPSVKPPLEPPHADTPEADPARTDGGSPQEARQPDDGGVST